nr:retrovirus-related Pol polyprotein from transposon TNT 1-94 [Tanacetum cinerariifolium]
MTFFLGLQVNQSPSGIFINQSKYVYEILKKYGLNTSDIVGAPMDIKDKLDLDQIRTPVDATKYRSMIGALMYLTSSRPDIVHATCVCVRYQAHPIKKHLKEVKRIFCYLWGTVNMGLWYTKDSGFELTGFPDADYAGCKDTFKSTSGGAQFLGEKLVRWSSKKQNYTSLSTIESEFVSLSACCAQVLWMRTQLTNYGYHFDKILICCDSKSAIAISCNPIQHSRTKHIAVRYHFIKEHVEKGTIELYFVKTDYQLADIFTKALPVDRFNYLVHRLGMRSLCPQELDRLAKLHDNGNPSRANIKQALVKDQLDHKHAEGTAKNSQDNKVLRRETKSVPKINVLEGLSKPVTAQTLPQTARQAVSNTNVIKPGMYRIDNRPQLKSNQSRDKVVPNNSQVKVEKTQVEVHPRIPSVSNKMKSVTACKDSLNSRTLNANVVCATCNKRLVNSNHFDCVTKMLNDVNAKTKKPNVVPISTRKPKSQANKSVATHHKKKVASKSTKQKLHSYFRMLYEKTSKAWKWWIEQQSPSGYKWVPKTKMQWVPKAKNDHVQKRVSFVADNASRITNVLKRTNSLGSKLSTVPSSSNSLVDCTTHPIHY